MLIAIPDREQALRDNDPVEGSAYEEEEDEWSADDNTWTEEEDDETQDGKDESTAYLDFLNEEVGWERWAMFTSSNTSQAQKFGNLENGSEDESLAEESLLETPLDKVEPYILFRNALMSEYPAISIYKVTSDLF